jgi:thiamine biosynthesis lipoprotein
MRKYAGMICAALVLALTSCGTPSPAELRTEMRDGLLGTVITISAYTDADAVFEACFDVIADVDRRMTNNSPDSEISRVNQNAGNAETVVSPDTRELLSLALDISRASGGAFDVSVGAVTSLWKEDGTFARLPDASELREKLSLVAFDDVLLPKNDSALLAREGMMLDLGGIAKGYACDRALEILKEGGVNGAFLDLGGNIYAHGTKENGAKWRIGVRYPAVGDNSIACVVEVSDKAVVTSGGYERYFERDGVIYHHILDPKTGYPADTGLLSVTVVAGSSVLADALSTACFVLGLEDGMELLEEYSDCEGIFITEDGSLHTTRGLEGQVTIVDARVRGIVS